MISTPRAGYCVAALLILCAAACRTSPSFKNVVQSETGFDGACDVVEERTYGEIVSATVDIPYLGVAANPKIGQGRIFVRKKDLESQKPVPVFCHVQYEKDLAGAQHWCEKGWAVATAHYKEMGGTFPIEISLGDGYNLAHALLEWVRRQPFVDRSRMHIDGGSQGGYLALAMSADIFPVCATTADFPVVNWAYNLSYFEANRTAALFPQNDIRKSPLPVLCAVTGLADQSYRVFGDDLRSETWYRLSPISFLDRITNPVLVTCATGDMLVPMEQITRRKLHPYDPATFPQGYQRDFDPLTVCAPARKTIEELLPADNVHVTRVSLPEDSYEITLEYFTGDKKKSGKGPKSIDRPWAEDCQWSFCYLDEGPPAPYSPHTRFEWNTSPDSFVAYHKGNVPAPILLTEAKLDYLMQRYTGELKNPPVLVDGRPANRLNFKSLEQIDVLTGLLDYAALSESHLLRLQTLYKTALLKPFGPTLDVESLKILLKQLQSTLYGSEGTPKS